MTERTPRFELLVPEGDNRERRVCGDCGFVDYVNPKVIVGSVVTHGARFLLCKRAIEPRRGHWTIPAGFMEVLETPEEGAAREAMEEATATIGVRSLLGVYTVRHISQVQLIFHAELLDPAIAPGPESLEVALLTWDEIPWDDLAFPTVRWALEAYQRHVAGELVPERRESGR